MPLRILESVTKIDNLNGLDRHVTAIHTTKDSCAQQYAEDHRLSVELIDSATDVRKPFPKKIEGNAQAFAA